MWFDRLKRREFMTLLGGAATLPIAASGQPSSIPVIGFINGSSATAYAAYVQLFIRGLAETGHTVGENVAIEYRWAEGHYDRIPDMVDDLLRRRVAVLAPNTPAARAAKRAAGNVPIVFFTGEDPVASGLVASMNRPGGNATGVTSLFGGLAAKQVGLLHDLVPAATLIGFLVNPRNPITEQNVRDALDAAQKLGEKIEIAHASSEAEIDAAFDTLRLRRPTRSPCTAGNRRWPVGGRSGHQKAGFARSTVGAAGRGLASQQFRPSPSACDGRR
jgi:putative ABC transport system substrate-binding protein